MSNIVSDIKMQFYPTNEFETHRILGILGDISYKTNYYKDFANILINKIGQSEYESLSKVAGSNYNTNTIINFWYNYFLNKKDYEFIKDNFTITFRNNTGMNGLVIADLFAGNGRWLDSFKTIMSPISNNNELKLLANELEVNRFNEIKNNSNIDMCFNNAFEDLILPKKSISIMLYNPPYGSTNGVRNVKYYLQMILKKQLLYNYDNEKRDYYSSYNNSDKTVLPKMVFVIRKDDFLDSLELITQNFVIYNKTIHKAHKEEYEKYKQYIFVAELKNKPIDFNNIHEVKNFKYNLEETRQIIESEPEFDINKTCNGMYNRYYPKIDYENLKENIAYLQQTENKRNNISKNDKVWKWVKELTEIKDISAESLTIPKNLKAGEIANIISSGYINGNIQLENNTAKHIVIGGTKKVESIEETCYTNDEGKKIKETQIIKLSKPYLNILCKVNNKLIIKELNDDEIKKDEKIKEDSK